ncbi:MAG: cytidylate kinase family protein [Treponema sp.]|nr:cytidylate kinase family protein [Treponema sp.]
MLSDKKDIKIAISGKSGCGNTTVSRLVADTLGLRFINFTFRNLARERGLELADLMKLAAGDDSWDLEVDRRQVTLAREGGGCVLGSRLAIWMLPEADLKVFLTASPEIRAMRIQRREGGLLKEIAAFTESRDMQDRDRYMRIYKIDNDVLGLADLVIDTDKLTPELEAEIIIKKLNEKFSKP